MTYRKLAAVFAVVLLIVGSAFAGHKTDLNPSPAFPGATATADVDHEKNGNTTVHLRAHNLAKPETLTPPATAYVVWVQPRGGEPQNMGQLGVNGDEKADFKIATPLKAFDLFVTAEKDPTAKTPSGQEALRQFISR